MATTILGIESSCDETAAAVLVDGKLHANIIYQQTEHKKHGGVIPEVASRSHINRIVNVVNKALTKANIDKKQLDAVAYTQGPGLLGSLMVGSSFAKSISYSLNIPVGKQESFYKKFNAIPDDEKFAVQKVEHRVQKGENLISIASKYRVLVADLQTINNISNINKLSIGQRLKIPVKGGLYSNYPEKKIYTVKKGDTLGHIAEDYNTRASEIRKWNNMGNSSNIYPGNKLILFVKGQPVKDTPKKNVYIVRAGDNLSMIAKNNNTTIAKIKSWNSMKSSTIYPGQKLTIYFE